MTLAGGSRETPGDHRHARRRHDHRRTAWNGTWSALPADPHAGISLTVKATTAAIVKIQSGG